MPRVDGDPRPRYFPSLIADKIAGQFGAQAILAALVHKLRTGEGQAVEVPMFECFAAFMLTEHLRDAALDPPGLHKARVDAVVELCDHHQVVGDNDLGLRLLGVQFEQVSHAAPIHALDALDAPESLVALLDLTPGREHPHLVPTTHGPTRQLHGLRLVLLEDQAERPPLHQRGELLLQVVTELLVGLAGLPQ